MLDFPSWGPELVTSMVFMGWSGLVNERLVLRSLIASELGDFGFSIMERTMLPLSGSHLESGDHPDKGNAEFFQMLRASNGAVHLVQEENQADTRRQAHEYSHDEVASCCGSYHAPGQGGVDYGDIAHLANLSYADLFEPGSQKYVDVFIDLSVPLKGNQLVLMLGKSGKTFGQLLDDTGKGSFPGET